MRLLRPCWRSGLPERLWRQPRPPPERSVERRRFGILQEERDVADALGAILQQAHARNHVARHRGCAGRTRLRRPDRRVRVRRLTASAVASGVERQDRLPEMLDQDVPERVCSSRRHRPVSIAQGVLQPAANNPRQRRIGVVHRDVRHPKRSGSSHSIRRRTEPVREKTADAPSMLSGAGCAKLTRTGLMSAPVLSRASLSARRQRKFGPCRSATACVAVSWTRNKRLSSSRWVRAATRSLSSRPYRARRSSPCSSEGLDRRAYSMRSSAPRGSDSSEMNAERVVAREGRGEAPRRVGDRLGDAHVGIVEPSSARRVGESARR